MPRNSLAVYGKVSFGGEGGWLGECVRYESSLI